MQMFYRLLLIVALTSLAWGCVKVPVESLNSAREVVARAYAVGASQSAPGEYQLASSALQAAELQVKSGELRKAARTLELAQRYGEEALKLANQHKQELLATQKKIEEEKRLLELEKQRELERQKKIEEQERKQQKKIVKSKPKKPVPVVKKKVTAVVKPVLVDKVEVQPGENLATIAGRPEVYNDPMLWPLIYKANRDQIKDPKEIFLGQIFVIPRDKTKDEEDAARQEAHELNLFRPATEK